MRSTTKILEGEVFWNWAKAEALSERFGNHYDRPEYPNLKEQLANSSSHQDLPPECLQFLIRLITCYRQFFLKRLMLLNPKPSWYKTVLDCAELPELRLPKYDPYYRLAPKGTLRQFVQKLDCGYKLLSTDLNEEDVFNQKYAQVKLVFDSNKLDGCPILLGESLSGPFQLIEGYLRLSCLTSLVLNRKSSIQKIPVIVGITPNLKTINLYNICN